MEFYCHFTKFLLLRHRSWRQRLCKSGTNPKTLTACGDDDVDCTLQTADGGRRTTENEERTMAGRDCKCVCGSGAMETKLLHLKAN